jgi:hypothetical protein
MAYLMAGSPYIPSLGICLGVEFENTNHQTMRYYCCWKIGSRRKIRRSKVFEVLVVEEELA